MTDMCKVDRLHLLLRYYYFHARLKEAWHLVYTATAQTIYRKILEFFD